MHYYQNYIDCMESEVHFYYSANNTDHHFRFFSSLAILITSHFPHVKASGTDNGYCIPLGLSRVKTM